MASEDPKVAEKKVAESVAGRLAAALLELRERHSAMLLEAILAERDLTRLGPDLGLSPLPGKRWKTMTPLDHATGLVRALKEPSKRQAQVLAEVMTRLPAPHEGGDPAGGAVDNATAAAWLALGRDSDRDTRVRALLALLLDPRRKDSVATALDGGFLAEDRRRSERTPEVDDPKDAAIRRLEAKLARLEEERAIAATAALDRERALRLRIEQMQTELDELRQRLGKSHRENADLRALYETAKGDLETAFRRAARFKQALDETKSATDRERELLEAYAREKQRADIEAAKLEILEYELDVLAHDEEPAPPATKTDPARDPVLERIRRYESARGVKPRILIVGGAGKQRSHRDRDFETMKARLGIEGEWRFADYGSWHRDLPRLRNDIQHRFDLVFVLHWNRTTFVQKMHDEARALNRRVRTVPYRGFLSLERAITEEVDRFVSECGD